MTEKEELRQVKLEMNRVLKEGRNDEVLNDKYRRLIKSINGW